MNVNIFHKQNCTQILILFHFWVCPLRNTIDMTEGISVEEIRSSWEFLFDFQVSC